METWQTKLRFILAQFYSTQFSAVLRVVSGHCYQNFLNPAESVVSTSKR